MTCIAIILTYITNSGIRFWWTVAWFTNTLYVRLTKGHHLTGAVDATPLTTQATTSQLLSWTAIPMILSWVIKTGVQIIQLKDRIIGLQQYDMGTTEVVRSILLSTFCIKSIWPHLILWVHCQKNHQDSEGKDLLQNHQQVSNKTPHRRSCIGEICVALKNGCTIRLPQSDDEKLMFYGK